MAINPITVLKTIIEKLVKIDSYTIDKSVFENVFCTANIPEYTVTVGSGWTIDEHSAYICGNNLRVYGKCTRSSATTSGDIPNETMMTFNFTDERITAISSINSRNYKACGVCAILLEGISTDTEKSLEVILTHTHSATTTVDFIQNVPINIDISKY